MNRSVCIVFSIVFGLCLAALLGCGRVSTEEASKQGGTIRRSSEDQLGGCCQELLIENVKREGLVCENVYVPRVLVALTDARTGAPWCGEVHLKSQTRGTGEVVREVCQCKEGALRSFDLPCHINPPIGRISDLTIKAAGFAPIVREVALARECEPRIELQATLPAAP